MTKGNGNVTTQGWAIRLDRHDAAAAGRLRQVAGVEVCEIAEAVWLRGPQDVAELLWQLAAVARRFSVPPDGQVLPLARGCRKDGCPGGRGRRWPAGWAWKRRPRCSPGGAMPDVVAAVGPVG